MSAAPDRLTIALCIPVRDEERRLPRLFDAIERCTLPADRRLSVCLLLDGCIDGSAMLAARYRSASRHDVRIGAVDRTPPNAGVARHRAMEAGIAAVGAGDAILLTSDADSLPAPDWLVAMVAALAVADVVAGDVIRRRGRDADPAQGRIEAYYAALFALRRQLDPVPWEAPRVHHHASGANMGLRAATYRQLGGFAPLARGEDARLVDDAARAGLRVRRDAASVVHTSARRLGRVRGGLATMLREVDRHGLDSVTVAHPLDQCWQYRMQAIAREAFDAARFDRLSAGIGLDRDHLLGTARDCPNAEAFAMRVVPTPPGGMRAVPFLAAEAMLAAMTATVPPAEAA